MAAKDGSKYIGVLAGASVAGELEIVLKHVRKVSATTLDPPVDTLIIAAEDLVHISAMVDFSTSRRGAETKRPGFQTDADISGNLKLTERKLHKWVPDSDDVGLDALDTKPLRQPGGETSWNQFRVNEELFGVKSDFDEELYTTKLNRDRPDFRELEQKAIRIANEIQASPASNPHIFEERHEIMAATEGDGDMDEEERYGAVIRSAQKNGKYIPPFIRSKAGALSTASETPKTSTVVSKTISPKTTDSLSDTPRRPTASEPSSLSTRESNTRSQKQASNDVINNSISSSPSKDQTGVGPNAAAAAALSKLNITTLPSKMSLPTAKGHKGTGRDDACTKAGPRSLTTLASRVEKLKGDQVNTHRPMTDITSRLLSDREKIKLKKKAMLEGRVAELVKFGNTFKARLRCYLK